MAETRRQKPGLDWSAIRPDEWDAARRMAEAVNTFVLAENALRDQGQHRDQPPFIAIDLEDGRCPDNTLYDTRADATRHQSSTYRFYVKIGPQTMGDREALVVLMYARRAYKAGVVFTEEEPVLPQRLELLKPFTPRTLRGIVPPTFRGGPRG